MSVGRADFHITIGFKSVDVHDVRKDSSTLVALAADTDTSTCTAAATDTHAHASVEFAVCESSNSSDTRD